MYYTYTDMAISRWGFEDKRTLDIARAEEKGYIDGARRLYLDFLEAEENEAEWDDCDNDAV